MADKSPPAAPSTSAHGPSEGSVTPSRMEADDTGAAEEDMIPQSDLPPATAAASQNDLSRQSPSSSQSPSLPRTPAAAAAAIVPVADGGAGTPSESKDRVHANPTSPVVASHSKALLNQEAFVGATLEVPEVSHSRGIDAVDSLSRRAPAVLMAFTVQCNSCKKWRKIPTLEQYETIRATISCQPFFCEYGQRWRPGLTCDDPADLTRDDSLIWAMDKPDIPKPPPGFRRRIVVRGGQSHKFSDVYYHPVNGGKGLRSMNDVEKYLQEHPELEAAGVTKSQFSFASPKPLPLKLGWKEGEKESEKRALEAPPLGQETEGLQKRLSTKTAGNG